jgi:hypothetical protein
MKKVLFGIILVLCQVFPQIQLAVASDQLIVIGNFPNIVDTQTNEATFQLGLPTSVTLSTTSSVKWEIQKVEFKDNLGYSFDYARQVLIATGSNSFPYSVQIENQGRQAKFIISTKYGTVFTFHFAAIVDGKTYVIQKNINFLPVVSSMVVRPSTDLLPGFKFETSVPDPGKDLQVQVKIRATANPFTYVRFSYEEIAQQVYYISFSWVDKHGKVIQEDREGRMGDWQTFVVPANLYQSNGMIILARWCRSPYSGDCYFHFKTEIPVTINFPAPQHSISLDCEEVFRDAQSKCLVLATSVIADGTPVELNDSVQANVIVNGKPEELTIFFGQPFEIELPISDSDILVQASIDAGRVLTKTVAKAHTYALPETLRESWKIQCKNDKKTTSCSVTSTATSKEGFSAVTKVPFVISTNIFDPQTEQTQNRIVRAGDITVGAVVKLSFPFSQLLQSIYVAIDEKSTGGATWENPNFVEPFNSSNLALKLTCPKSLSGSSFSCTLISSTTSNSTALMKVDLQYKSDNSGWTTLKSLSVKPDSTTKVSMSNKGDKNLYVRALVMVTGATISSNISSWVSTPSISTDNPNKNIQIAAIRLGLRDGCKRLPYTLNIEYVGPGPSNGGNRSWIYTVNKIFSLMIFDLGESWNFAAYPLLGQNQNTAALWNCGAGGKSAVIYNYFVKK